MVKEIDITLNSNKYIIPQMTDNTIILFKRFPDLMQFVGELTHNADIIYDENDSQELLIVTQTANTVVLKSGKQRIILSVNPEVIFGIKDRYDLIMFDGRILRALSDFIGTEEDIKKGTSYIFYAYHNGRYMG